MGIIGVHALVYAKKAEEIRAFFKDTLGWKGVDAGGGWPIFQAPPAELAVHPADDDQYHELYLMCDDVDATIAQLKQKGVACDPVSDQRWGRVTSIRLPGGTTLGLYQPLHPLAIKPA